MALLLTNLASPKVVDKISKLLTKTDVLYLQKLDKLPDIEQSLREAWGKINDMINAKQIADDRAHAAYGKFCIRMVLHAVKKEKLGWEAKTYSDYDAISRMFSLDLIAQTTAKSFLTSSSSSSKDKQPTMASLAEASSAVWIASQKGFDVGKLYNFLVPQAEGADANAVDKRLVGIAEMGENHVLVQEITVLTSSPEQWSLTYQDLNLLTKFTGKAPALLPKQMLDFFPKEQPCFKREAARCELFAHMASKCMQGYPTDGSLKFALNPTIAIASKNFKRNELKLPLGTDSLAKVSVAETKGCVRVEMQGVFWVGQPAVPKTAIISDMNQHMVMIPFWWVSTTDNKDEANMEYKASTMELVNVKAVKSGDVLKKFSGKESVDGLSAKKRRQN